MSFQDRTHAGWRYSFSFTSLVRSSADGEAVLGNLLWSLWSHGNC